MKYVVSFISLNVNWYWNETRAWVALNYATIYPTEAAAQDVIKQPHHPYARNSRQIITLNQALIREVMES